LILHSADRFAFAILEPRLGNAWRKWVTEEAGIDPTLSLEIERRLAGFNELIAQQLGNQFRIGHSYVTPPHRLEAGSTKYWFRHVAET
jgi:5-methylcytosine-specific restriction protein B